MAIARQQISANPGARSADTVWDFDWLKHGGARAGRFSRCVL